MKSATQSIEVPRTGPFAGTQIGAVRTHRPIIVTGMHRSGTSLVAGLLSKAGVAMGADLLGAGPGNANGHFENVDVIAFHRGLLQANNESVFGWTLSDTVAAAPAGSGTGSESGTRSESGTGGFHSEDLKRGRELLQAISSSNPAERPWGWKDPRTTLFLPFWDAVAPDAVYIFVFRPMIEVADSLYRRGADCDAIFREEPELAPKLWAHYNRQLIQFFDRHPGRCLLVEASEVVRSQQAFLGIVAEKFSLPLATEAWKDLGRAEMSTDVYRSVLPEILKHEMPEADRLYRELLSRAVRIPPAQSAGSAGSIGAASGSSSDHPALDLHTWTMLRLRESELAQVRREIQHLQGTVGELYFDKFKDLVTRLEALEAKAELRESRSLMQKIRQLFRS